MASVHVFFQLLNRYKASAAVFEWTLVGLVFGRRSVDLLGFRNTQKFALLAEALTVVGCVARFAGEWVFFLDLFCFFVT